MPEPCGDVFMNMTRRSGSGNGTGFNKTAFTTEKIAVFVPIPSANAASAATVKAGFFPNIRSECFRSLKKASMRPPGDLVNCGATGRTLGYSLLKTLDDEDPSLDEENPFLEKI